MFILGHQAPDESKGLVVLEVEKGSGDSGQLCLGLSPSA